MSDPSAELSKAAAEGLAKGAVEGLLEPVKEFFSAVAGVPVNEASHWLGDIVRFQRWKTQVKILAKAEACWSAPLGHTKGSHARVTRSTRLGLRLSRRT